MIKAGIAGIGFMGWIHWLAYQRSEGIEVGAICSRDSQRRAGDWTSIQGNFGPPGERVDLAGISAYEEFDQLVNDPELDLIDICLPPNLHVDSIVAAVEGGKHVFCEKPLALGTAECNRAIDAAKANGKMLMVGHILAFFNEYQFARESIDSGRYGKPLGGNFKRVISDPVWLEHFYDRQVTGGPLFDLHVHDAHFIRMIFGMPEEVQSSGRVRGEVVEYAATNFQFPKTNAVVSAVSGVINQQGRPFMHGYEIHLERATLHFEYAALAGSQDDDSSPLKIFSEDGSVELPELGDGDPVEAFVREMDEVVRALDSGQPSPILDGELARDAIQICQMQSDAILGSFKNK